jgi:hypothetical protein
VKKWTPSEDKALKKLAGIKTASEISTILERPIGGVHYRIKKLGLKGRLHGEHHWNAKFEHLSAIMLQTLHEAGFKPKEIHETISRCDLTYAQVKEIIYRKCG